MIGAGNVASALAPALNSLEGVDVVEVFSRSLAKAEEIASPLGAHATTSIASLAPDADIYIISVSDKAIPEVVEALPQLSPNALLLHTSGATPASVLAKAAKHYGVWYPMQTFTRGTSLNVGQIPFFIEGNDEATELRIQTLSTKLSPLCYHAGTEERTRLHAAAVFACNFVNHLWAISEDILRQQGMSFDIMTPLIDETLRKALAIGPAKGQTGPALRHDQPTMDRHRQLLTPEQRQLYDLLSDSIQRYYNPQ